MFRNITLGQYMPGTSFVHRLDPRVKILITLVIITILFMVDTVQGMGWCSFSYLVPYLLLSFLSGS